MTQKQKTTREIGLKMVFAMLFENLLLKKRKNTAIQISKEFLTESLKLKSLKSLKTHSKTKNFQQSQIEIADIHYLSVNREKLRMHLDLEVPNNAHPLVAICFDSWKMYNRMSLEKRLALRDVIMSNDRRIKKEFLHRWAYQSGELMVSLRSSLNSIFRSLDSSLKQSYKVLNPEFITKPLDNSKFAWMDQLKQHEITQRKQIEKKIATLKNFNL